MVTCSHVTCVGSRPFSIAVLAVGVLALPRYILKLIGKISFSPNKRPVMTTKSAFAGHGVVFFAVQHELAAPYDQIAVVAPDVSVG